MRHSLLFIGVILSVGANALVLDDFTTGYATVATQTTANYNVAAGVPGGTRAIDHDFMANPNHRSILTDLSQGDPGNFYIESGSNVDGAVDLYWANSVVNGTPNDRPFDFSDFTGLGGADLSSFNAFQWSYTGNDQDSTTLVMRVEDTSGNVSVFSGTNLTAGNGMAVVNFADFVGSADFSMVNGIHGRIVLPTGNDITLTNFEVVPEPATLLALGLGAATLLRRRRNS